MTQVRTPAGPVFAAVAAAIVLSALAGAPAHAKTQHMYVSEGSAHAVLRFPMQGGIPAERPDGIITGLNDPRGVSIGPDHRLYVVDRAARRLAIYAPMPGTGSKPVKVLPIGHPSGLGTVEVDPKGYVYVTWAAVCTTEGFFCGYADVYSSFAKGMHHLVTLSWGGGPPSGFIRSIAVDQSQTLMENTGGQGPTVYYNAPFGNSVFFIFCGAANPAGLAWGQNGLLIESDLGSTQASHPPQVVVIPNYLQNPNCPPSYSITSATVPLNRPYALASSGGLIYVSSAFNSQVGSALVFVFDPTKQGVQTPLAVIGGSASQLHFPWGIAIGE
jgi:hypothetical protein